MEISLSSDSEDGKKCFERKPVSDSDVLLISTDSEEKKDAAKNLSIESDSSSLPSLGTADPISTMEKSNSDEDSAEKNLEPVINISTSNTDLSDDSGDSLTTR